jgi:hypothetical protein
VNAGALAAYERRPALAARAARAVTTGAHGVETSLAGLGVLSVDQGRRQQYQDEKASGE